MKVNLTENFPTEELNNYLVGRDFIRVSPLTGGKTDGTVKSISVVYDGEIGGSNYRPIIVVMSTHGITYDYNELYFNIFDKIEKRKMILTDIETAEEEEKIRGIGDI